MIDFDTIDLKGRTSGQIKTTCPSCSPTRKKKNDPCLSVNIDTKVARCHNCQEVSFIPKKEKIEYALPPQEWINFTNLSDKMVQWVKDTRNISQQTLIDCKITEEEYYQPALDKKVNNIVFNYFEGDLLVNKKIRSATKEFTQIRNCKKIFYGINDIIGESEAYIVEGEFDKLAMWEAGYKNVISVPNGANDLNNIFDTCADYLHALDKIYIAVDMDEAGQKLEAELLKRFGKYKCERIHFKGKDANDDLIDSVLTLQESLKYPISYPVGDTFNAKDIEDDIYKLYDNGLDDTLKPTSTRFSTFNNNFSMMKGQLTVVTGIPSHGKSNFIEDYVLNLVADCNLKASFFSPEHSPLELHQSQIMEKVIGKPFAKDYSWNGDTNPRMTKSEINQYIEWSKDKIFLTHPEDGKAVDWPWLLSKFKEQLFRFGTDIFVIDAYNKVKRDNPDSQGEINQSITDITAFCQAHNVDVILIAHPTKMQKDESGIYKIPDLYSVSGTADFRNQTHNGLSVYRYFGNKETGEKGYVEVHNLKTKFKHQGDIGSVSEFDFDISCNRYYNRHTNPDRKCLFELKENNTQAIQPNLQFENEINAPF